MEEEMVENNEFRSKHTAGEIAEAVYNELVVIGEGLGVTPIANIPLYGYARDKSVERLGVDTTTPGGRTYMKYWRMEKVMPEHTDLLVYDLKKKCAVSIDVITSLGDLRVNDDASRTVYEPDKVLREEVITGTVNNPNVRSSYIAVPEEIEKEAVAALKCVRFGFRRSLYGSCGIIVYDEGLNMRIAKKAGRKPVTRFTPDDERKLLALHIDMMERAGSGGKM